jgi:hypothetical protein
MASIPLMIADPLAQERQAQDLVTQHQGLTSMLQDQQLQRQQIQQNQINLNDQKSMSDAMHEWDGKDINDLPSLMIQHGASASAVLGMKQHINEFAKQQADTALAQGQAGKVNLENQAQRHQNIADAMNNAVITNKDGSLNAPATSQALDSLSHNAEFTGNLAPDELQQLPGLVAHYKGVLANDPQDFQDQWGAAAKGHLALAQQHQMALDQLDEKTKQLTNTKTEQETQNTAADIAARNAWLSLPENVGKTAADWENKKAADLAQATAQGKAAGELAGGAPTQAVADNQYRLLKFKQLSGETLTPAETATMGAYEKQKTLNTQVQFSLQNAGSTGQNGQPSAIAKALADGSMKWNDFASPRTPMSVKEQILSEVKSIKPDYNSGDFEVEQKVKQTATSGAVGQQLLAIGTARQHMQLFSQLADALDNGNNQTLNKIGNALGIEFGSDKATNLKIAAQAFGGEVGKAFDGAGVTAGEREQAESAYSDALAKGQFKGAVQTVDKLLAGKQKAAHDWFDQGMQAKPNFGTSENAAPAAQQHVPGGKAAGLTEGQTGTGSDGKKYVVKGGVWVPR